MSLDLGTYLGSIVVRIPIYWITNIIELNVLLAKLTSAHDPRYIHSRMYDGVGRSGPPPFDG